MKQAWQYQCSAECPYSGDVVIASTGGGISFSWPPGNRTLVCVAAMSEYKTGGKDAITVADYYHPALVAACDDVVMDACNLFINPPDDEIITASVRSAKVVTGAGGNEGDSDCLSLWVIFSEDPEQFAEDIAARLETAR